MSEPLVLAIPSKGRLQENTAAFFRRAGLPIAQPGGARNYRGVITGFDGVEIAFLSASEIARDLGNGKIHLGITGLDLIHETVLDRRSSLHLIAPLGYGHATVVVAVPKAWIDVHSIADIGDIASDFRARHGRQLRLATKYVHLTRAHFAAAGIADYRIVESLGATEGAPAAGSAEMIVDITTTGSTLAANHLKVPDGGIILDSQAHLVASRRADWGARVLDNLKRLLDRVQAEERARTTREIRTLVDNPADIAAEAAEKWGCALPLGTDGPILTLHCPQTDLHACIAWLRQNGAGSVTVGSPDYVFEPSNPLFDAARALLGDG